MSTSKQRSQVTFTDDMTLGDARRLLQDLYGNGERCPCCTQWAQIYKRSINTGMVKALQEIAANGGADHYVHTSDLAQCNKSGEVAKLAYWGLLEDEGALRADGGRAGYWKITEKGVGYLAGHAACERYALLYDGNVIGHEGPLLTLGQSSSKDFKLDKLRNQTVSNIIPLRATHPDEPAGLFDAPKLNLVPDNYEADLA